MSAPASPVLLPDPSSPWERYGLRLVDERSPQPEARRAPAQATPSFSRPPSISDWIINVVFGGFLVTYAAGLGYCFLWLLERLCRL